MNTRLTRVKNGIQQDRGHGNDERELKPACDRDPPRRSVEILCDLGLSQERIVAYYLRFPTPTSMRCGHRPSALAMPQ